ncbi:hypothetical protein ACOME3_005641 [Neoechinorhynchus agilis]
MLPSSNRLNEKDPMVEAVVGSFLDPSSVFLSAAVSGTRRDTIPAITADQLTRPISVENRPESTKCPCSLLEQIEDSEIIDAVRVLTSKRKQILKRINETAQCLSSIVNYTYFRPQSCQSRKGTQVANRMVKLSQAELSRVIDTESKAAAALIPPPTSLKRQNSSSLLNAPRKRFALAKQGPYDLNDIMLAKAVEIVENGTDIDIFNYEIVVEALKRIPLIQAHIDPNMKFELEKRLINRAQRLAEDGMWSSLRMPKLVEPPKPQTTWDKTMAILCPHAYKSLVKYKATMNASHRRLMASLSKRFKNQGEDEKAMKRMAAQCSRLIDKYWKSVGKMYRGKQKLLHEQQYRQALDAHLKTLINRSQRYTELVRAAVDETDDNFIVQDDDGEFVGDEEDVSEEDVSWSDEENLSDDLKALEREGELALSELVKEALPTDLRRQWMSQNVYKEIDEDHETSLPLPPPEKKQKSSLIPVPFLIKGTLRPYQHTGIDWLSKLYMNGLNGILADEMGLGKTIQTIAFLAHLACEHGIWGPHLVVVPTSVVLNWEVEFKRWLPSFKLLTYYGSVRDRKERRKGWTRSNAFHVCITSYQTAIQDAYILKRRRWNVLVLDEAQQIKNFKSQRWQVLLGFRSRRRLLLTGTVLQNTLMELWSLMHFLMPKLFASHTDFKEWFSSPVASMIEGSERVNEHLIRRLHQVLRPFILRRLKNEVEREMPKKHEHVIKATLSKRQKFLYEDFMSRSDTKKALETGHYMSVINVLMQLRKVCNHPDLFETRLIHSPFVITDDLWCRFPKWMKIDRNVELGKSFVDLDRHETHCGAIRAHQLFPGDIVPKIDYRKTDRLLNEDRFTNIIDYPLADFIVNKNSSGQSDECANGLFYAYGADGNLTRSAQYPHIGQTIDFIKDRIDLLNRRNRQRIMFEVPIHGQTAMKFLALPPVECPLPLLQHGDLRHFHARNRIYVEAAIRSGDIYSETSDPIYPDRHFLQFDSGKLQILARLLAALKQDNHRVLIFSQMTRMLDIIAKFLSYHGYTYLRLDGTCDIERRQRMVETFNQNSRYFCFILSTRSGGLGLNLTGADTVVFYDSDWNPTMDAQAQDRCHRIGQTREVNVYRLICRHSVEESILLKANQKRILSQVVIDAAGLSQTRMTSQNIRSLFFTVDQNVHENVDDVIGDNQNNKEKILEQALLDAEDEMDRDAAAVVVAEAELDGMEFTEDTGLYKETQEQVKQIQHNIDSLTKEMKPIEKRSLHQMEKNPEDYNHILDSFSSKAPLPQETFAIKEDVDLLNDSDDREDDVMYTDDKVNSATSSTFGYFYNCHGVDRNEIRRIVGEMRKRRAFVSKKFAHRRARRSPSTFSSTPTISSITLDDDDDDEIDEDSDVIEINDNNDSTEKSNSSNRFYRAK